MIACLLAPCVSGCVCVCVQLCLCVCGGGRVVCGVGVRELFVHVKKCRSDCVQKRVNTGVNAFYAWLADHDDPHALIMVAVIVLS